MMSRLFGSGLDADRVCTPKKQPRPTEPEPESAENKTKDCENHGGRNAAVERIDVDTCGKAGCGV